MGRGGTTERETFLDAVRTTAILRVIVWHAFGAAAITYVVSAVPAMFFVTGSLLARSLDRHGARRTVLDRLRRMLIPLWAFAAVAFLVMSGAARLSHATNTAISPSAVLWWLVPLWDPKGSAWEAGWLSSPLWYLRALLWMVLAAPLLLRLVRRAPVLTVGALAAVVFGFDLASRHADWPLQQTRVPWIVGDFALYAMFVALGFLHRDGRLARLSRGTWALAAVASGLAAAAWVLTQPVHRLVVNDSHPMHLFVGFAWLALALALQPQVERVARRRGPAELIRTMNSRSMSVYLWHSSAIIVAYQLLWRLPFALPYGMFSAAVLGLTAIGTVTLVSAFGWIEDLAAGRRGALWPHAMARHPRRTGSVAFAGVALFALVGVTGAVVAPLDGTQSAAASGLVAPSQQPPTPTASTGATQSTAIAVLAQKATSQRNQLTDALDAVVTDWLRTTGVDGAQVAIMKDHAVVYAAATGTDATKKNQLFLTDTFDAWSITKTYTAWLVLQLVQDGRLSLDAPVPRLTALPAFDTTQFTLRQLLDHSTGLVNYRDTKSYLADPSSVTDAVSALRSVMAEPLHFAPGTRHEYSSSNYLVLGLLLEQITGRSYDALLREQILDRFGLNDTSHAGPTPGNPNFSTGGIMTDIVDMVSWADLYLSRHLGIDDALAAQMQVIDGASAMGLGTVGFCPCGATPAGQTTFSAIGHFGSTTEIQYAVADGTTIAVNLTSPLWDPASRYQQVIDLFAALRSVVDSLAIDG